MILWFTGIAGNAQDDIKSIQIVDSQGKPVKGVVVSVNMCGKDFKLKTKEDGTVKFNNANCASSIFISETSFMKMLTRS